MVVDQAKDRFVSLEIAGKAQGLSVYLLPRSETSPGVWERGKLMESIEAAIYSNADFGDASDDDIYWDNRKIMVDRRRNGKCR
jgi:hypothetical protein